MWPKRVAKAAHLVDQLAKYSQRYRPLPGIARDDAREVLAWQMVASLRRLDYTRLRKGRSIDPARANPNSEMFDPELAATLNLRAGNLDEAFWVTFLATHFGKHHRHGWQRLRDVYSGLGRKTWTWEELSGNPGAFRLWLAQNINQIGGAFSNHRKYETLRDDSTRGAAAVVESYIDWVGETRSHQQLITRVTSGANDPHANFYRFYQDMQVKSFGRLGKFDFLALVGRLDLAPISPASAFLVGATGPLRGARLLFGGSEDAAISADELQHWLTELDALLNIGMQPIEDSLCNWQKSPQRFVHFKG